MFSQTETFLFSLCCFIYKQSSVPTDISHETQKCALEAYIKILLWKSTPFPNYKAFWFRGLLKEGS
jgi:hypothetical protein